jgi:hypothetical protein
MKAIVPAATLVLMTVQPAGGYASAPEPTDIRRFALVVGANRGAADRVPLRYAVADAERFAEVVTQMGGVRSADRIVLRDPSRQALLEALTRTGAQAGLAKGEHGRVEVIVYFSGHADDQGLMLGREVLPYRELRAAVGSMGADVGITILDACASGAITRLKGGRTHPAFLTGGANVVKGYAFLTSSSENETAQESERLRGSFFTHALVSGLRGAADVSGDGRVTLNEVYQFAFHETLVQTTAADGGAQHPSYDIKMAGTGEVVMTDLRQTSASLILGEDYDGRFFVLSQERRLVAELFKPRGRKVELGLDAGEYEVLFQQDQQRLVSKVTLVEGQHKELLRSELREAPRHATTRRGGAASDGLEDDRLDGRLRGQFGATVLRSRGSRFTLLHWARPTLAYELGFGTPTFGGSTDVLLGARYYPPLKGSFRPYAGAALGRLEVYEPVFGGEGGVYEHGIVGGELKVGLDVLLNRSVSMHFDGRGAFTDGRRKFSTEFGLGWSFGGRPRASR